MKFTFINIQLFVGLSLFVSCQTNTPSNKPPLKPISSTASPSPSTASPSPSPENPSPSPDIAHPGVILNPQFQASCWGAYMSCLPGQPCAVASCAPEPAPLNQDAPLFIEEVEYEKIQQEFDLLSLNRAEDSLGGLSPQLPIAKALKRDCKGTGLYANGGRLNACVMYVVQKAPNQYVLLQSAEEAAKVFAPIDTREEALSFAVLLTGHQPKYKLTEINTNWRYYSYFLSPTIVRPTDQGYELNLFHDQVFGCGPHPHFEVKVSLTKSGELTELDRTKLYEDPDKDGLCVD